MAKALDHLTILEIGDDVAARYCGRLFAEAGATVVRRKAARADNPTGRAFDAWLDGAKSFDDPPSRPDLVIGGLTKADRADAAEFCRASGSTLLSLSWFGDEGPYAGWTANDSILQAMTGVAFNFGLPEGPPTLPQGHAPQIVAGLTAFIAALAGLMTPARRPARIDVNVFEASLCFAETGAVAAAATGVKSRRIGVNRYVPTYPCQIYPTRDGAVGVTTLTPAQWTSLTRLIGRPELDRDPRFTTTYSRLLHGDLIDEILAPYFAARTTMDWVGDGDRERIPITPTPRPGEAPYLDHWRDRGAFAAVSTETGAPLGPTAPYRFRWAGAKARRPEGGPLGPLAGIRVADFSMGWAGPLCGRYLGDLGADVIKIESTVRPDWWRGWEEVRGDGPPSTEIQRNFLAVNRNKRGMNLDLGGPDGLAKARRVIAHADVVIENLGPGVMDRLGLGPHDQRALKPDIVSIYMPPFGKTGPLAGLRAYGSTVEQASGMPYVNGHDHWSPAQQHVAYGDPVAGLYAAAAALIGLHGRERLGGPNVELCQVEGLFQLGAWAILFEQVEGRPWPRTGNRRADASPCCVVACEGEEDWLTVVVDTDAAWSGLCQVLGRADWAADAGLATIESRQTHADRLEAVIADWARTRRATDAAVLLQAAGVPAAPVIAAHDLHANAHLGLAGYWMVQDRMHVGEHLTPGAPFRFDGRRPEGLRRPAPVLGEHTEEVLAELTGRAMEQLA